MKTINDILFPKDELSFMATIISKKQDFIYLVKDSAGRQYQVESSQIYPIGIKVICKNGIIIRSTKNKIKYKNFIV